MAARPCSHCHFMYRGPASAAYVAIVDGPDRWQCQLKLCPSCWKAVEDRFDAVNGKVMYEQLCTPVEQSCLICRGSVFGRNPQSVFMTAYPSGQNREDYFAPVCGECRPALEASVEPRTSR